MTHRFVSHNAVQFELEDVQCPVCTFWQDEVHDLRDQLNEYEKYQRSQRQAAQANDQRYQKLLRDYLELRHQHGVLTSKHAEQGVGAIVCVLMFLVGAVATSCVLYFW